MPENKLNKEVLINLFDAGVLQLSRALMRPLTH